MMSEEIDYKGHYARLKADCDLVVAAIKQRLDEVQLQMDGTLHSYDDLLRQIAHNGGFEHVSIANGNGNGHKPKAAAVAEAVPKAVAPQKKAVELEPRKYIRTADGKKKAVPRQNRVRDGYAIDRDTGYVRHSVLRAGIEALRRLGTGSTITEIHNEALRTGATFDRTALRTCMYRNPDQEVAVMYRERKPNEDSDRYYLWEWRPGTTEGRAAIKSLHLEKVGDTWVAPQFDVFGELLNKPKQAGTVKPKAPAPPRQSKPAAPAEEVVTAVRSDEPPHLDPSWPPNKIHQELSSTQRFYMFQLAKLGKPRISAMKFALEPEWAAKVHRGEIKAEDA